MRTPGSLHSSGRRFDGAVAADEREAALDRDHESPGASRPERRGDATDVQPVCHRPVAVERHDVAGQHVHDA